MLQPYHRVMFSSDDNKKRCPGKIPVTSLVFNSALERT